MAASGLKFIDIKIILYGRWRLYGGQSVTNQLQTNKNKISKQYRITAK